MVVRHSARPPFRWAHTAPLLAAACVVLVAACSDYRDPGSNCGPWSYNAAVAVSKYKLSFIHQSPKLCPVLVPEGGAPNQSYQAVVYVSPTYGTQYVNSEYYDADGNSEGAIAPARLVLDPRTGNLRAAPQGSVFIGSVNPVQLIEQGDSTTSYYGDIDFAYDQGLHYTTLTDGNTPAAVVNIDYDWPGSYSAQASPAIVQAGNSVTLTVNATSYNRATGPVTYRWTTLDGTYIGSGSTAHYTTAMSADPGAAVVTITDANGRTGSYQAGYSVTTSCTGSACAAQ